MKVNEMKDELEKVSKIIPELREELDQAYKLSSGKKSQIKLLWKEYENRVKEMRATGQYRDILQ